MLKLITDPDKYFSDLKSKNPDLKKPALIVAVLATIGSYYQYRLTLKLSTALPDDVARFFIAGSLIGILGSFLGIFATWLIVATIMHGLAAFFDARGEFRRTFEFAGYGFLPSLFGSAITVPVSLRYIERLTLPKVDVQEFAANPEIVAKLIIKQFPSAYVYSMILLNVLVTMWSLLIWIFAVKNAREIGVRNAIVCAATPTAIFAAFQLWGLVGLM